MLRSISEVVRNFFDSEGEEAIEEGMREIEKKENCYLAKSNIDKFLETGHTQYLDSAEFLINAVRSYE